ncbi:N-acetylglucosamine-6-phosphate deacetylase [Prochlorococcus marinus]|uniref:N-acetylglucosamine-6-phosphate deacetylase n=1 Tax=Prochlorococcus marinus TaxID=1219 RepID=UPI0022B37EA9|nr:N-acetylglucosamine-6-phosphate deacetylase [Prochlorococcus marinus]
MRKIKNIKLPQPDKSEDENSLFSLVLDEYGIILSIDKSSNRNSIYGEDWCGDWLSPRAIDLQINGGLGISFTDLTFNKIPKLLTLLDRLWLDGVEGICPTFVSCSIDQFQLGMKVLKEAKKHTSKNRCRLLGAHMEGPFLCESYSGAHDIESICKPSISALNQRIKGFEDDIALMTLAPELIGSFDVISRLRELNILVSLGHSSADFDSAMNAFNNGVTMVTHTFNAMKGLHHRAIGPIGAAARRDDVFLGLIADGVHVHADMIRLLKILAPKQIVLVSDAISAYGLGDGSFDWDKRLITVENGLCRLPNDTIAGSTLPLLDACKKIAKWINDPSAAIWMGTLAPRMVLSQKKMTLKSFFIGKNIQSLLRWKINSCNQELSWHMAA